MGNFTWNASKNATLRQQRQVSFEKLIQSIESGGLIADQENTARPDQRRLVIFYNDYVWVVPYVIESGGTKFLKTAYPSRKLFRDIVMLKKTPDKYFEPLDEEEKSLMQSDEGEGWINSKLHTPEEWKQMAAATLKKEQRITIRINAIDLYAIKQKAADLGIPYQTLIGSTLHGVAVGDIDFALTQKDR